jgi:HTH-type transcriptional regulator/antitoxin HigA
MNEFQLTPEMLSITSPPGDSLLETLEAMGMSQAELARRTGRPVKTINEIVKGKTAITPETALQFERVLGIPASFWNNRERQYRESLARQEAEAVLQEKLEWLEDFPISELIRRGWIHYRDEEVDQVEELLAYLGIASPELSESFWLDSYPPLQDSPSFKTAPGSVMSWLRQGELVAGQTQCDPFDADALGKLLEEFRGQTQAQVEEFYPALRQGFAQAGVAVCIVPAQEGCEIDAVTRWLAPDKAMLLISTRCQADSEFWFALYHALCHIMQHGKREVFIKEEGLEMDADLEAEADSFAAEMLVPETELKNWLEGISTPSEAQEIIGFSRQIGTPAGILVGRLQREGILPIGDHDELKLQLDWPADRFGDWPEAEGAQEDTVEAPLRVEGSAVAKLPEASPRWPGLSQAARQAMQGAGLYDEAGRTDEALFAGWMEDQLAKIESAYTQGFRRDALSDLKDLASFLKLNRHHSPVIETMLKFVSMLIDTISVPSRTADVGEIRSEIRQAIREANQPIVRKMTSETRREYSVASTQTERSLAESLFESREKPE